MKILTAKRLDHFLNRIERTGNRLPHPVALFVLFIIVVIGLAEIASWFDWQASIRSADKTTGEVINENIEVISLLNAPGIRYMFERAVSNFVGFAPLGVVIVSMLGVAFAEATGFIHALLRKTIMSTPSRMITPMIVFIGVMSNLASDAGNVIVVPLGALIFLSVGRHPLAGLAAAFAGVSGGFSANLLLGSIDPILASISTEAAHIIDPDYFVAATGNYYFMFVSTFLVVAVCTLVNEKIIEPRLGKYHGDVLVEWTELSANELRALKYSLWSMVLFLVLIAALVLPENAALRDHRTGNILGKSPFIESIVIIISLLFFIPGLVYGYVARTVNDNKDLIEKSGLIMGSLGTYLILIFVAAQFISYFRYTNLGVVTAFKLANFFTELGFAGFAVMFVFGLVTAFFNLFIGSAVTKWSLVAPVFVPMFMLMGFTPEFTQLVFRVGDSATNIISPLMPFFAIIVTFAQKYDKHAGMETLISIMLPHSLCLLISWMLLMMLWYFSDIPIGPGAVIHL